MRAAVRMSPRRAGGGDAGAAALARGDFAAAAALAAAARAENPKTRTARQTWTATAVAGARRLRARARRARLSRKRLRAATWARRRASPKSRFRAAKRARTRPCLPSSTCRPPTACSDRVICAPRSPRNWSRARRVIARQRASKRPRAAAADADADGVEDLDALFGAPGDELATAAAIDKLVPAEQFTARWTALVAADDHDGDGSLSFDEFLVALCPLASSSAAALASPRPATMTAATTTTTMIVVVARRARGAVAQIEWWEGWFDPSEFTSWWAKPDDLLLLDDKVRPSSGCSGRPEAGGRG